MPEQKIKVSVGNTFRLYTLKGAGTCASCGSPVLWVVTDKHKPMPVDFGVELGKPFVSHFATCPHAKTHRKSRPRKSMTFIVDDPLDA